MNEPKPCPFCGHMPKVFKWEPSLINYKNSYEISCESDSCPASPGVEGYSLEFATTMWNTRHMDIAEIDKMSMEALLKAQQEQSNG